MSYPHLKTNVVFQKGKEKKKQKEKEKEKKKKKNKVVKFCLETRTQSEGCMAKAFETDALSLDWLGVIDFVFVTWVDR